jgi:hypothetical protein
LPVGILFEEREFFRKLEVVLRTVSFNEEPETVRTDVVSDGEKVADEYSIGI